MDPAKLAKFTKDKLIPEEASQYLCQIVEHEMPNEGFKYTAHKKALYYDGHECPDVTLYRQETFIPSMKAYDRRLVKYVVGQVENEEPLTCFKVETKLVLCAHDEMTAQANDGQKMSWIWKGEQPLKKKGLGHGLHQSDFICSTVGWLKDASQTLEYGKNYEGYWNGELFVKQLKERFFSAFEAAHGPGYQALVLIDNSQGHSAYAEDALLTSRMNMHPGGKQANLRDGWFMNNGQKLIQKMNFPENHPQYPSQTKGMQQVLMERGLYHPGLKIQCKKEKDGSDGKCDPMSTDCCAKRILNLQPDFQEQKSLVQEVIEEAGHLCIFLPKFHCELNFIEFFWGAVKRHLRANGDGSFATLQENMGKALASVSITTIWRWEHRMKHWLNAYDMGMDAKEAEKEVRKFSTRSYKSHRRIHVQ
ncbi:hypothetical protein M422DRAFT_257928 [Sphaerobolus stellatus SS14]|uniref:Tc1-like transposase DDE domain-containing protein n=1 Tax=Sphaerobolus stellatus (strain SS14) TaxID=990650 RepID=A0A0C9VMX0_SPHS4|nr:hypothetical protein M422DRAFT_257928 [Sphaerobolus stellatus SS14]